MADEKQQPTPRALTQKLGREITKHIFEEAAESSAKRVKLSPAVPPPKRPFFRKRLYNEPPLGEDLWHDYDHSEHYDEVQKEFKETHTGPADLEWKTAWLDLFIECELLVEYIDWTFEQTHLDENTEKEKEFYSGLWDNIVEDSDEVDEDIEANNARHGKTEADMEELKRFADSVRETRVARKERARGVPNPRDRKTG